MGESTSGRAGTIIEGKFRIDKLVAHGGFTDVYLATRLADDERVAVKVLELDDDVAANTMERFSREAKFISELTSRHTIRVFEWGQVGTEFLYTVMEYIPGRSLHDHVVRHGALNPRQVAQLGVQVCDSLIEVHERGLIHRDIKPSNVMLFRDDGGDVIAKVLDFGIAKIVRPEGEFSLPITRKTGFVGTPRYAAPEQLRRESLTPAADVYGVGMTLWEALVGDAAVEDTSFSAAMKSHTSADEWSLPDWLDCPPEFGAIVQKSLAKTTDERYQSCVDLKEALQGFLDNSAARSAVRDGPSRTLTANVGDDRQDVRTSRTARKAMPKDKFQPENLEDVEAEDELFGDALNEDESHIEDVNVMARSDLSESSTSKSHIPLADRRKSDHAGFDPSDLGKRTSSEGSSNTGLTILLLAILVIGGLYLFTMGGNDEPATTGDDATATTADGDDTAAADTKAEPPPESDEGRGDGTPTLDADTIIKGIVASGWRVGSRETDKMDEVVQTGILVTKESSAATVTIYESRTWEWAEKLLGQTEPPTQAITFGRTVVRVSDGPQNKSNGAIELGNALRTFKSQARERAQGSAAPAEGTTTGSNEDAPAE